MPSPSPSTVVFETTSGSSLVSDSPDACESFLESYSRGKIDVGGIDAPADAQFSVAADILASGHFPPPDPPDEPHRVRELYPPVAYSNVDINFVFSRN
jgi:hypothetical protein